MTYLAVSHFIRKINYCRFTIWKPQRHSDNKSDALLIMNSLLEINFVPRLSLFCKVSYWNHLDESIKHLPFKLSYIFFEGRIFALLVNDFSGLHSRNLKRGYTFAWARFFTDKLFYREQNTIFNRLLMLSKAKFLDSYEMRLLNGFKLSPLYFA